MTTKTKAKRKLSNIDFSNEGAHIALCHADQGVANGANYALVVKTNEFTDEFIEKIQQVKVTLELPDFLARFFHIYEGDAKVLATMMGYVEPAETQAMEAEEAKAEYQDWIESRMEAFEIIKAAHEGDVSEVMSDLEQEQYLALLQDQEKLEKAMLQVEKQKQEQLAKAEAERKKPKLKHKESPMVVKSTEADVNTSTVQHEVKEGKGNSPVVKQEVKEVLMTDNVKVVEEVIETEVIEKSAFDAIQKQAVETQELLKSALAELEIFKAEKAALIAKARKQSVIDAVKDEAKAEQLFKSIGGLADEQFESVVAVVKSLAEQVEKSALFQEQGATVDTTEVNASESAVAKILKAQFSK
jgi:galactitol-specific phosphotransferase system IIB component